MYWTSYDIRCRIKCNFVIKQPLQKINVLIEFISKWSSIEFEIEWTKLLWINFNSLINLVGFTSFSKWMGAEPETCLSYSIHYTLGNIMIYLGFILFWPCSLIIVWKRRGGKLCFMKNSIAAPFIDLSLLFYYTAHALFVAFNIKRFTSFMCCHYYLWKGTCFEKMNACLDRNFIHSNGLECYSCL